MKFRDRMKIMAFYLFTALIILLWVGLFLFVIDLAFWASVLLALPLGIFTILYIMAIVIFGNGIF